ncbi:MAG: transcription termination/antitermination protein NusA, partial [Clostridia bacterium]|nr:transcription termination/antitermination protein NusA [Clostridia bacterium]
MINKDFFLALEDLEREKGIRAQAFIEVLQNALVFAYKKNYGVSAGIDVRLNPEKHSIKVYSVRNVVEEVENPDDQISVEDAQQIKANAKPGDVLTEEITPKDFGR